MLMELVGITMSPEQAGEMVIKFSATCKSDEEWQRAIAAALDRECSLEVQFKVEGRGELHFGN